MKRTLNVNIGGVAFTVDEDAYQVLDQYLQDVRSRLEGSDPGEVMADIESRIAELFSERITHRNQVVNIEMAHHAMEVIGRPDMFGERRSAPQEDGSFTGRETPPPYHEPRKLYRSRRDRIIGGVCGGIARYFDVDVTLVRVLFAVLFFTSVSLWIYIILWIVMPLARESRTSFKSGRS